MQTTVIFCPRNGERACMSAFPCAGESCLSVASLWKKPPIFLFKYKTINAEKIKPAEAGWFCVISCAVHAPLGALAALYATDDDIHGEVHERRARLGGRELLL